MSKQVQRRRGTATQHTSFTGAEGEISVNTTNKSTHVHDGVTAGGIEAARADLDNVDAADVLAAAGITASAAELNHVDGVTSSIQTQIDAKAPKNNAAFTGGVDITGNMTLGDNDKAIFGAGSDLQIYHDNSASYVSDQGSGPLNLLASQLNIYNAPKDAQFASWNSSSAKTYIGGSVVTNTTSTGVDVTGTLISDGLTVDGITVLDSETNFVADTSSANKSLVLASQGATGGNGALGASVAFSRINTESPRAAIAAINTDSSFERMGLSFWTHQDNFASVMKKRMVIDHGGDISFYEDTGTTPKFFWDASAESLGIGTSSPSISGLQGVLTVASGSQGVIETKGTTATDGSAIANIIAYNSSDVVASQITTRNDGANGGSLSFITSNTGNAEERMRIDSSGNVGIGGSPSFPLDISGSDFVGIHYERSSTGSPALRLSNATTGSLVQIEGSNAGDFIFKNGAGTLAEAMRIDSSGNLLVGKTSFDATTTGSIMSSNGEIWATRSNSTPMYIRRLSSDGTLLQFNKDGTTVGSIGTGSSTTYFGRGSTGLGFSPFSETNSSIFPINTTTAATRDNAIDLGLASARFDDVYATNGSIQTSDRNEKQDIEALNDAETRVAQACKSLLRKFRWQDAVAEKGDDARIHFGIIAQDLQDAFAAEGLDAGRYAMFISSTWWETQTEVPAVEAVAEVLDDDGNVVTEAVEAKDAYTRTDTYDTLAEAPDGATERTRLGVRYPELLAFIIAAI